MRGDHGPAGSTSSLVNQPVFFRIAHARAEGGMRVRKKRAGSRDRDYTILVDVHDNDAIRGERSSALAAPPIYNIFAPAVFFRVRTRKNTAGLRD